MTSQLNLQDSFRHILGAIILLALLGAGFFVGIMAIVIGAGLAAFWLALAWWQRRKNGDDIIHAKFHRTDD